MNQKSILKLSVVALIAISSIFFYSCRKRPESISTNNGMYYNQLINPSISVINTSGIVKENDYLHFNSLATFWATLDALDTGSVFDLNTWDGSFAGFQSMRKYYDDLEEVMGVDTYLCLNDDESLASVLNTDGIVQIENTAYLLDYSTNSVYEVYPANSANIDSLKLKNEINNDSMYLFKYSMDDEIFFPDSMVQARVLVQNDGTKIPVNNTKRAFRWLKKIWGSWFGGCNDNAAKRQHISDKYFYTDDNKECVSYRYKYKIRYQKSGLRFALIAKAKHHIDIDEDCNKETWRKEAGRIQFDGDFQGKVYCGTQKISTLYAYWTSPSINNLEYTHRFKFYFYKSGSKLAKYLLRGQFWLKEMDDAVKFPYIIYPSCNQLNTPNNCFEISSNWP